MYVIQIRAGVPEAGPYVIKIRGRMPEAGRTLLWSHTHTQHKTHQKRNYFSADHQLAFPRRSRIRLHAKFFVCLDCSHHCVLAGLAQLPAAALLRI